MTIHISDSSTNSVLAEQQIRAEKIDIQTARLINIARYIEDNAEQTLTLATLAHQIHLSPSRFQRLFKQTIGVSPKVYQDAIRMDRFKHSLQQGSDISGAIYAAGYGSISRIYGEATRSIGMTPKAYRAGAAGEQITYATTITALGPMTMAATKKGVCFVQFGDTETTLIGQLTSEFPNAKITQSTAQNTPELNAWINALDQHISANAPRPDIPLDIRGTAFQMKVWQFLLSVRDGTVLSYSELAAAIDKPTAVRAVASACGKNRIGVLIPCHRVLRSDGGMGGYRWGLERKRALLEKEQLSVAPT
jgi:AraC family transcriptional regulator of adaptative response/methylated-DNA-[protein]-cysteine methyltransferase